MRTPDIADGLSPRLAAWLESTAATIAADPTGAERLVATVATTRQRRSRWSLRRGTTVAIAAAVGVAGSIAVLSLLVVSMAPTPSDREVAPGVAADPSAASSDGPVALRWETGLVTLTAQGLEARTQGQVFEADRGAWLKADFNGTQTIDCQRSESIDFEECLRHIGRTDGDLGPEVARPIEVTSLMLQAAWFEGDTLQRLIMELRANDVEWWVHSLEYQSGPHRNGRLLGDRFSWKGPLFKTPLGRAFRGDVVLSEPDQAQGPDHDVRARRGLPGEAVGTATLRIDGLDLKAFDPATLPAPLSGCDQQQSSASVLDVPDLLAKGQLLHGTGILDMSPAQVGRFLDGLGLCHEFSYGVEWNDWEPEGRAQELFEDARRWERWCEPPPRGDVIRVESRSARGLAVIVIDSQDRPQRVQPPAGFGCPTRADPDG